MSNQKQGWETIAAQYTILLQNLSDLITAYYFLGKLGQAHQLLNMGMQLIKEQPEVAPQAKCSFLLHAGILQARSIIYLGHEPSLALETLTQARDIAESIEKRSY